MTSSSCSGDWESEHLAFPVCRVEALQEDWEWVFSYQLTMFSTTSLCAIIRKVVLEVGFRYSLIPKFRYLL